ncbi:MAG: hypothetical protein EZS26_000989 [Candidatus Ordinivivax streblomastigis]|uniref:Uncharacterized protein n=1 Tax=Candidatus Ordinivivax streblomastigis TaxID=2540710 RepID=A0A5M8P2X7_9BACT|nr:MAG: hypothetical protein EZS26_000989 [Candidatus Ordinivivax streblomastigis]
MNEQNILNHQLLWRIVLWEYNRYQEESLTEESFIQYYGGCFGSHFYSKWRYYDYNFMKMIGYFGGSTENGQKFCDMVMEQVIKYEQRKEQVWKQMN